MTRENILTRESVRPLHQASCSHISIQLSLFESLLKVMIALSPLSSLSPLLKSFLLIPAVALCDWSAKQKTRREILYPPMHPKAGSCMQDKLCASIDEQIGMLIDALKNSNGCPLSPRSKLLSATGNIFYRTICTKT